MKRVRIVSISEISNYSVVSEFEDLLLYVALIIPLTTVVIYLKKFGSEVWRNCLS